MECNAASCNSKPGHVQAWDTEVKATGRMQVNPNGNICSIIRDLVKNPLMELESGGSVHMLQIESTIQCCSSGKYFFELCLWRKSALLLKLLSHVKIDNGILKAH